METMVTHRVKLTPECLEVDGQRVAEAVAGESFLTQLYRKYGMGYPKFFKRNTSLHADRSFQATIADAEDFYPSPSVFVYTLPNIVTGEIAIRNKYHGESEFILLPEKSETAMNQAVERALMDKETTSVLVGWVEALSEEEYEAEMELVSS